MILSGITESIVMYSIAALGSAFGIQQYLKNWKAIKTESSLITLMHVELERHSKQNKDLCDEVIKLQMQVRELHTQLNKLSAENEKLHSDVNRLTVLLERYERVSEKGLVDDSPN